MVVRRVLKKQFVAMNKITIRFDGGCIPNPGQKYGSYEVCLNGRQVTLVSRLELGYGTNNEAEFEILEAALRFTVEAVRKSGHEPAEFDLELFSDSTVVVNRLLSRNKTRKKEDQQRMHLRAMNCLKQMILFRSFTVNWNSRWRNLEKFGH